MPLYNPVTGSTIVDGSATTADIADGTIAPADESTERWPISIVIATGALTYS